MVQTQTEISFTKNKSPPFPKWAIAHTGKAANCFQERMAMIQLCTTLGRLFVTLGVRPSSTLVHQTDYAPDSAALSMQNGVNWDWSRDHAA